MAVRPAFDQSFGRGARPHGADLVVDEMFRRRAAVFRTLTATANFVDLR
jgi:hypothetical protein